VNAAATNVAVLGIRHHGPGSARAVRAALDEVHPDIVLIEGAPELTEVAALATAPGMEPPVAGLVYAVDTPATAVFFPMASFSPEWVALRWALEHRVAVRFVDLPATHWLARGFRMTAYDPLATMARLAGYDDPERWWEDVIEHVHHGAALFDVVRDAMSALRAGRTTDEFDSVREAAMRKELRAAMAGGPDTIAFVCGAWHAPAIHPDAFPSMAHDAALLRSLPKVKVAATWVPWTASRLSLDTGYGAGVASPAWYAHLFTAPADIAITTWMTRAAHLLRAEQHDVSPGAVIDAVRLAEALAVLRGRGIAGLEEVMEAAETVLCGGQPAPLALIRDELVVGHALGSVPDDTPMVPLARDVMATRKRLRMKVTAGEHALDIDLRQPNGLERSQLLWRLALLDVPWGEPADVGRTRGTFKEAWLLEWHPELDVALIEASGWGTTVVAAATARAEHLAREAGDLTTLTGLVEQSLLAGLDDAFRTVMAALSSRAATQHDTTRLMAAVEPLARVFRYGDVRRADIDAVGALLRTLVTRIAVGLPSAVASLDDDAATAMRGLIDGVHRALAVADDPAMREQWTAALARVADQYAVHGAVAGRAVRLLLDAGHVDAADARRRLSLALSRAADAVAGAAWLEAFLSGDALLLVHDHALLAVIDEWLLDVGSDVFDSVVPVLRRAFAGFSKRERRVVGEHVARMERGIAVAEARDAAIDAERADRVLPRLREILGDAVP